MSCVKILEVEPGLTEPQVKGWQTQAKAELEEKNGWLVLILAFQLELLRV